MKNIKTWMIVSMILTLVACEKENISETIQQDQVNENFTPSLRSQGGNGYSRESIIVKYSPGTTEQERRDLREENGVLSYRECKGCDASGGDIYEEWSFLPESIEGTTIEERVSTADPPDSEEDGIEDADFNYIIKQTGTTFPSLGADNYNAGLSLVENGSGNTVVAVLDTGINATYFNTMNVAPFLFNSSNTNCTNDPVWGWDFVEGDKYPQDLHGHGTAVSYLIASSLERSGINYEILPLRVFDDQGTGNYFDVLCATKLALAFGADIVNMSFGMSRDNSRFLEQIISEEGTQTLFVASAGNNRSNNDQIPHYPSSYGANHLLAIAAANVNAYSFSDPTGLTAFSNYGAQSVDLAAPGKDIQFKINGTTSIYLTGSSYANAYASAFAATLYTSGMSGNQLRTLVVQNSIYLSELEGLTQYSSFIKP